MLVVVCNNVIHLGADTNMKLKHTAMSFVQWVFRQATAEQLKTMGPVVLSGLIKLLSQLQEETGKDINDLKSFTYNAIGLLAKRVKV
jgi:proteasome component ECM29